jgi:hypothetical protein
MRDQGDLVSHGRVVKPRGSTIDAMARLGKVIKTPFASLSPIAIFRRLIYLPLNLIPLVGPIIYLSLQARRYGPQAHARYFQLKGMNKRQREEWVKSHIPEYTG